MKVISMFSIRPGCMPEAVQRFLGGKATPPAGMKVLGRWHKTDGSGGYGLYETDDPAKLYEYAASWGDVLEIHSNVVIEDAEAGAVLGRMFGK
ncbi:MAG: DUF3303 family protein [Acidobacteriaceae bacterium]